MSIVHHPKKTPKHEKKPLRGISLRKRQGLWSKTEALANVTGASREWFSGLDGWHPAGSSASYVSFKKSRGEDGEAGGPLTGWDEIVTWYCSDTMEWCIRASWGDSWGQVSSRSDPSFAAMKTQEWDRDEWEGKLLEAIEGFAQKAPA